MTMAKLVYMPACSHQLCQAKQVGPRCQPGGCCRLRTWLAGSRSGVLLVRCLPSLLALQLSLQLPRQPSLMGLFKQHEQQRLDTWGVTPCRRRCRLVTGHRR